MTKARFTPSVRWTDRTKLPGMKTPGVYALAITSEDISEKPFRYIKEIVYFGMTNSGGGLQARLNQFDYTIAQNERSVHGGAERFLYKYKDYPKLIKKLFVSICSVDCDSPSA